MFRKVSKRLGFVLVTGSILFQGCIVNNDDLQLAAANSVQSFLSDLFAVALTQWINAAFNVPG